MNHPLQEDIEFLEHFGVKGQQWGVRKAAKLNAKADKLSNKIDKLDAKSNKLDGKRTRLTEKAIREADGTRHAKRMKLLKVGAAAVAVGAGSVYASKLINQSGARKAKSIIPRGMSIYGPKGKVWAADPRTLDFLAKEGLLSNFIG